MFELGEAEKFELNFIKLKLYLCSSLQDVQSKIPFVSTTPSTFQPVCFPRFFGELFSALCVQVSLRFILFAIELYDFYEFCEEKSAFYSNETLGGISNIKSSDHMPIRPPLRHSRSYVNFAFIH